MAQSNGSAAVALVQAVPQSAVRQNVARCAERLAHASHLAASAARGPHPLDGAEYLLDTLEELRSRLADLESAVRASR